ncbi:MAG: right-handed parallel beta-helix repeat-containing protein [Rikenellaceae bacterium]
MNLKYLILTAALFASTTLQARDYYVSPSGSDKAQGTKESPLKTISKAVSRLQAGDHCYIRGGTYREKIDLTALCGTPSAPITIEAYAGEKVILSGAEQLNDLKWSKESDGVYSAPLKKAITQLFVDGKSMTSARFPNANWYDGSVWDKSISQIFPESGAMGRYENRQLSQLNFSLEGGGMIVVNSGSFKTYVSKITKHEAGSTSFEYDKSTVKGHFTTEDQVHRHGYFIEGKRELIDTPEEWFYDTKAKILYLYTPNGKHPRELNIEGKVQTHFFNGRDSKHIAIRGIEFFGTTIYFNNSYAITIEDCNFKYPSYSRRMVGDIGWIEPTSMLSSNVETEVNYRVVNCDFSYGDGPAIKMRGRNCLIENCSFSDFDYSCINAGGFMFDLGQTMRLRFRRNTAYNTGNSEMLQVGREAIVELNDLSRCGFLQNDGSLIQVSVGGQDKTVIRYNWLHDAVKQGIRFDNSNTPNAPFGKNCTAHHNVVWNTERMFIKGDNHLIFNNTCFDNVKNDLIISANLKINGRNYETVTKNNLAGQLSGDINKPNSVIPAPGHLSHNYECGDDIGSLLRDHAVRDFRPKATSPLVDGGETLYQKEVRYVGDAPDIGAYEYGDANYWIAGKRLTKASSPIPMADAQNVKIDSDLIWLGAYKQSEYKVYFGEDATNLKLVSTQKNNIFTPSGLKRGGRYFWRVNDGEVWSFTVEKQ